MQKEIKELKNKVTNLKNLKKSVGKFFGEDQMKILQGEYMKVPKWSNDTLLKGYRLKFA